MVKIIEAKEVTFTYEDGFKALNNLTLTIEKGKKIALMGANGSGKSTFFLCLNGIHRPQKGTLFIQGVPVQYSRKQLLSLRARVGIVFQEPDNQLFCANVIQEIAFGPMNLGLSEKAALDKVNSIMARLGILPIAEKPVHALSGGQKKQVAIADILVMEPDILILDEPAAALDPRHTRLIYDIIDELSQLGMTILIATHDVDYAFHWSDEILLFHEGQLLAQAPPLTVFRNPSLLKKANLQPPQVLSLFDNLSQKGVLSSELEPPKTLLELENYIVKSFQTRREDR